MLKRRNLVLIYMSLAIFIIFGCSDNLNIDNNTISIDSEIEAQINNYIETNEAHITRGGKSFAEHKLYGTEVINNTIYVYLWAYYSEYYVEKNELKKGGGGSYPLVIVMEKESENKYNIIEHQRPEDGNRYSGSIRKLFPEKYHEEIFSMPDVEELDSAVKEKAKDYYDLD